jgi:hypothetical protein
MIKSYQCFSGQYFDQNIFKKSLKAYKAKLYCKAINIGILGQKCSQGLIYGLEGLQMNILFDFTCSIHNRDMKVYANNILLDYTYKLLNQFPCITMQHGQNRHYDLDKYKYYLSGIIYTTTKSCTTVYDELQTLQDTLKVPILKLESNYTNTCETENINKIYEFIDSFKRERENYI